MRLTTLGFSATLALGALAACHRSQTASPNETSTTTRTVQTSSGDVHGTPMPSANQDTTNAMARNEGGAIERREVHVAIRALDHARYELEHAGHDYGGHRADALRAVDGALRELRLVAGQERGPNAEAPREERRERIELREAVRYLERARADMEHAKHDFGGRRAETLSAVDTALRELRLAREHETK